MAEVLLSCLFLPAACVSDVTSLNSAKQDKRRRLGNNLKDGDDENSREGRYPTALLRGVPVGG